MNGVFFNMYRNGDLFITKEFVQEVIAQLPMYNWHYAHGNHQNSLKDIGAKYLSMPHFHEVCDSLKCESHEYSEMLPKYLPLHHAETLRNTPDKTLYINTWAGCYHGTFFPFLNYPNMHELINIWQYIGRSIKMATGKTVDFNKNIIEYFPTIDFSFYEIDKAKIFIESLRRKKTKKIILASNGPSMSNQSKLESMDLAIVRLAAAHEDYAFVVTQPVSTDLPNIYNTKTIFKNAIYDLPQISYLSLYCDVIIGKNSGPFTFCHTYQNIMNDKKMYFSFSNEARDNLLYDVPEARCKFFHSNTESQDEVYEIINDII